jgi:hypothetical protein
MLANSNLMVNADGTTLAKLLLEEGDLILHFLGRLDLGWICFLGCVSLVGCVAKRLGAVGIVYRNDSRKMVPAFLGNGQRAPLFSSQIHA